MIYRFTLSRLPEARREGGMIALWGSSAECVDVNKPWVPNSFLLFASHSPLNFREPTVIPDHRVLYFIPGSRPPRILLAVLTQIAPPDCLIAEHIQPVGYFHPQTTLRVREAEAGEVAATTVSYRLDAKTRGCSKASSIRLGGKTRKLSVCRQATIHFYNLKRDFLCR